MSLDTQESAIFTTGYAYALMQSLIQATLLISSISLLRVQAEISSISLLRVQAETCRQASSF
ncbi:MAG: hypothetical protein RMY62_003840 [Nostoc sp. ZfuVER08]|uniref:Uncharacterized protein n=1 Tax=Nostoc punctiforme FACHB-252 TaxID=1357509 RepID=A0ABR8H4H9_NOSPU|nr:hypothetical protein [Nostoc punctiforme]MBD2609958.1 hypothetical protein [Nostoc punctiforme FACHB-252]MDZ8015742.1 hypothetical protein [Nostoc sp. ZfuVER08]